MTRVDAMKPKSFLSSQILLVKRQWTKRWFAVPLFACKGGKTAIFRPISELRRRYLDLLLNFKFKFYQIILSGITIIRWVTRFSISDEILENSPEIKKKTLIATKYYLIFRSSARKRPSAKAQASRVAGSFIPSITLADAPRRAPWSSLHMTPTAPACYSRLA
jgi:hypothetical protein